MTMTDLGPAAGHLCVLTEAVHDRDLGRPTPCTEYTVGGLLHHIAGVTVAFGGAAVKARGESSDMAPWGAHRNSILIGAPLCPGVSGHWLRPGGPGSMEGDDTVAGATGPVR